MRKLKITFLLIAICLFLQAQDVAAQNAKALIERAKASIEKREFDSAIKDLTQSIKLNPKNGEAYTQRARAYVLSNKTDLAFADAEKALSLNPKDTGALNVRGLVKQIREDLDGAVNDFTTALKTDPKLLKALYNRGVTYGMQRKTELALADYNKVIELDPKSAPAYVKRAAINAAQVKDKGKTALADIAKALEIDPKLIEPYVLRAQIRYKFEVDYKAALVDLNEAVKLNPESGYILSERGMVNFLLKNYAQAEADLTAAIKFNFATANVYNNRALAYEYQDKIDAAKADYQQALKIEPNHELAKKNFENLLEKYPDCPYITPSGDGTVSVGSPMTFSVSVSSGDPNVTPTYNWYISAGKISSGQGTSTITVDTTGIKAGTTVTATIDVGGYPRGCVGSAAYSTSITAK